MELLFQERDLPEVARILREECGNNLPFLSKLDEVTMERHRFAALKLSDGDLTRLREAVELAKRDWRDLLVAAGFGGDPQEHERWLPISKDAATNR